MLKRGEKGFSQGTPCRMRKQRPRPEPSTSREEEAETQGQHDWLEPLLPVRARTQPHPWRKVEGQVSPTRHRGGLSRAGQQATGGGTSESGSERPLKDGLSRRHGWSTYCVQHTLRRRTAWGSEGQPGAPKGWAVSCL